jgi:phenylpropionate dioxygenase-like ring-hydroxylating dioxygenase large terminal subunit
MELNKLTVDMDSTHNVNDGHTLPTSWYTSDGILTLEKEKIFRKNWHYAGNTSHLKNVGDYVTIKLDNVPVVVVRNEENQLQGYVNVCRHRLAEIAHGNGNTRHLQCPYHAWTYDLNGQLKAAPDCANEANFDKEKLSLLPVKVDSWGPLVFANLDVNAKSIAEYFGESDAILRATGVDFENLQSTKKTAFDINGNWKVVAENYLECYHCPSAHRDFTKIIDTSLKGYRTFVKGTSLIATADLKPDSEDKLIYKTKGQIPSSTYILFWPNFSINIFPGEQNMVVFWFDPVSPTQTYGEFEYFFGKDTSEEFKQGLCAFWDKVGYEDQELIESVQRGLNTNLIPNGRLVLGREGLLEAFQSMVSAAVAG